MRSGSILAVVLLAGAVLAGCTGSPSPPAEPVTPTNTSAGGGDHGNMTMPNGTGAANDTGIVVKNYTGSASGVTLHSPAITASLLGNGNDGANFDVKGGATAIVLEVAWNSTSDKLNVYVTDPCNANGNDPTGRTNNCPHKPGDLNGTSPAKIVITDPALLNETGTWNFAVYADANVQGTDFQAWTSVFYGGVPGPDYSAIPKGG